MLKPAMNIFFFIKFFFYLTNSVELVY